MCFPLWLLYHYHSVVFDVSGANVLSHSAMTCKNTKRPSAFLSMTEHVHPMHLCHHCIADWLSTSIKPLLLFILSQAIRTKVCSSCAVETVPVHLLKSCTVVAFTECSTSLHTWICCVVGYEGCRRHSKQNCTKRSVLYLRKSPGRSRFCVIFPETVQNHFVANSFSVLEMWKWVAVSFLFFFNAVMWNSCFSFFPLSLSTSLVLFSSTYIRNLACQPRIYFCAQSTLPLCLCPEKSCK